jgi:transposase-like protein
MDAMLREKAAELAKEIAVSISTQQELSDVMRLMTKSVIERMLDAEMDVHLGQERGQAAATPTAMSPVERAAGEPAADANAAPGAKGAGRNRRNGKSAKTVQGESGRLTITLISSLTDAVDEEATAWRSRLLDPVWPIVYFDGIAVHVRGTSGRVSQHTIYVALGVNLVGKKELLGLWLAESEGAKFWLQVLTDLKNRGLGDIFVACVDGLAGFPDAIRAAYPQTKVQLCIVHLVRAALRYVTDQDSKAVVRDLKKIYQAATLLEAEQALEDFAQAWQASYPTIIKMWRAKWTDIITLFDFPAPIRKAISTTNAIESVNSVIRKFTRNRKIYPNEESALKITFMAIREASKKWTMPIRNWKAALNHFAILFEDRLPIQSP